MTQGLTSLNLDGAIAELGEPLARQLVSMSEDLKMANEESAVQKQLTVKVTSGSSLVLTAGYLAWVLRGGSLITSLLGTLPTWTSFDPLPVLFASKKQLALNKRKTEEAAQQEDREYTGLGHLLGDEE